MFLFFNESHPIS